MTADREHRARALDPRKSFIVQAPAGSGKTELLIQRYLVLLARVDVPEQVIAMTFTRKAAAEMRRRVLAALEDVKRDFRPAEAHRRLTLDLAAAVVARDTAQGWDLSEQPSRLRIETLDALNARLVQHLSVLAGGIGDAELLEQPAACYSRAVRRTLAALGSDEPVSEHLARVLRAVDGNVARLEDLLVSLLPTRDQWLPHVAGPGTTDLRDHLEAGLQRLISETIADVAAVLPDDFLQQAFALLEAVPASRQQGTAAPADGPAEAAALESWRRLPTLFLTKAGSWRKQLTSRDGFSADDAALKARCLALIDQYRDDDDVRRALIRLGELPSARYSDQEWALLAALRSILVQLVAELKVDFAEHNVADFIDLAMAAQAALGAVDDPSELLLALDHRVQHLLVDEFQDTSHSQLQLLRLLTSGWQRGDGRTLFLVGDPMQSIYRFRHADMSLFLKVWSNGFESLDIETIPLVSNFRSAPAVIDWVNQAFAAIFPAADDIGAGVAAFRACEPTRPTERGHLVRWHMLEAGSPRAEIGCVTGILRDELEADPTRSVAVLVRSRTHLHGLQQALRQAGLTARAVELEPPRHEQVVQDLITLTRALTHWADRVAWLGLLRGPWCGLTWSDLLVVANGSARAPIWASLADAAMLAVLSPDGRARVGRLRDVLAARFRERSAAAFAAWVEDTWRALGGPACVDSVEQLLSAERFFDALGAIASRGDLDDPAALADAFGDPYGEGAAPLGAGIEIMTIHRAKGLEFDSVVLLGLGRPPRPDETRALYWLERTADDGSEDLLLAPLQGMTDGSEAMATFIRRADAERDRAERARLLYVAATRARNRLHLVASIKRGAEQPPRGSLLEFLWHEAGRQLAPADDGGGAAGSAPLVAVPLRRLAMPPEAKQVDRSRPETSLRPEFSWARHAAVQVGTLVHAVLQEIGERGLERYDTDALEARGARIRRELRLRGVDEEDLSRAARRVVDAVSAVLADPTGRWLLSRHAEAASELPMTVRGQDTLEHLRIDRTFVDADDRRWVIDFKTSVHEGADVEEFLDSEVERYRDQLTRYAAAMAELDRRPIRVGLYFPLLRAFRSWQPDLVGAVGGTAPADG